MANETVNRQVNILITSGEAQKTYDALIKKQQQLNAELAKASDPKQIKALNDQLAKLEEPIDRASKKLKGQLLPTFNDLQAGARKFLAEWKRTGDPETLATFQKFNSELANQKNLIGGLQDAHQSLISGSSIFSGAFWANLAANGIQLAGNAIKNLFTGSFDEFEKADLAIINLDNSLQNLGDTKALEGLTKQTQDLKKQFTFLNEADITTAQDKLETFGKLTQAEIHKLIPVIVDYATKTRKDIPEATDVLIKALNGAKKGINTFGVEVSATNGIAKNFELITTQLADKVRGAADAFGGTAKGKIASFGEEVRNTQKQIGEFISKLIEGPKSAETLFDEAKKKTEDYTTSLTPLLARYDDLKSKTVLNQNEQNELRSVIQQIVEIVPSAATEFNKYGEALDINKGKVQDFVVTNKNVLRQLQSDFIKDQTHRIDVDIEAIKNIAEKVKSGVETVVSSSGNVENTVKLTDEQIQKLNNDITELKINAVGISESLNKSLGVTFKNTPRGEALDQFKGLLSGSTNADQTQQLSESDKKILEARAKALAEAKKAEEEKNAEKFRQLLNQAEGFNKKIRDLQQQSEDAGKTQNQKEIDDAKHKYDEILKEYHKLLATLGKSGIKLQFDETDIKRLEDNELAGIIEKQMLKLQQDTEQKFIDTTKNSFSKQIAETDKFFSEKKQLESKRFIDGLIDKKTYENNVIAIDEKSKQQQLLITQQFLELLKNEEAKAIGNNSKIFDDERKQAQASLDSGAISREQFEQKINDINGKSKEQQLAIEKIFSSTIEQFATNVTTAKKAQLDKQVQDEIAVFEKRKENDKLLKDLDNQALLSTVQTRVAVAKKGSAEELKAKQDLLALEHKLDLIALEEKRQDDLKAINDEFDNEKRIFEQRLEDEKQIQLAKVDPNAPDANLQRAAIISRFDDSKNQAEIQAEKNKDAAIIKINTDFQTLIAASEALFNKKKKDLTKENNKFNIESAIDTAQKVLDIFSAISQTLSSIEDAEVAADAKRNDAKKATFDKRLKAGLVTQLQYNREINKLDAQQQAKEREIKKKQFERQKIASIIQTTINIAEGVTKALASAAPPANFILAGLVGALGAVQLALITKEKAPEFASGGQLGGQPHSSGGNPILDGRTGKKIAEIEQGEGIINKNSMADKNNYTVTGTPSQIGSLINRIGGGVQWQTGGRIAPAWSTQRASPMNFPIIKKYFATGGTFGTVQQQRSPAANDEVLKTLSNTILAMQGTIADMQRTLSKGIKSYSVLSEQEVQQGRLDAIRKDATFK